MRQILAATVVASALVGVAGCGLIGSSTSSKIKQIVNHPWWRVKPTEAQVEAMAKAIVEANSYHTVMIDERGKTATVRTGIDYSEMSRIEDAHAMKEGLSEYRFSVTHMSLDKRETYDGAIRSILSELDSVEAKDGPASKRVGPKAR